MSYIGAQTQNIVSPQFQREVVTGIGTDKYTLIQDVPGFNADNIMVVVNNVLQEPNNAYTITADGNGNPRVLNFNGTNLAATDSCYVQHKGVGSLNLTPAAGSVNATALQDNLRSGNVDTFVGSDATNGATRTTYTMSEIPLNAQCISVFLNGVYQRPTTNYTVTGSSTVLTFTASLLAADEIDVHHHTIRSTVSHVPDGGVTSPKLDTNIQVSGTLGVTGASTLTGAVTVPTPTATGHAATKAYVDASGIAGISSSGSGSSDTVTMAGNLTVTSNLTVSGTTTTIDTATTTSDSLIVNNAGSDVGIKVNSTSTGNILQLQDGGVDKVVVADGGNTTFSGNVLVDTIAEKTSAAGVSIDGLKVKDSALVTDTNKYPFVKSGELNSIGYLNHNYFGSSYYLSTVGGSVWNNQSWMEVAKQSVSAIAWSKSTTTGTSGSDDADPFGKFVDGSNTGRWTPTISGYYLVSYTIIMTLGGSGNMFQSTIRVNGATTRGVFAFVKNYSAVTPWQVCNTATAIVPLDTNDYFSLWVYQDSAAARAIQSANPSTTQMSITYVGASDL